MPGAVTDGRVGAGGAAVVEVDQRGDAVVDDRVAAAALDVGHGGDTAGVTLELWVVQPLGGGCCRVLHGRPPVVGGVTASRRPGTVDMSQLAGKADTRVTLVELGTRVRRSRVTAVRPVSISRRAAARPDAGGATRAVRGGRVSHRARAQAAVTCGGSPPIVTVSRAR